MAVHACVGAAFAVSMDVLRVVLCSRTGGKSPYESFQFRDMPTAMLHLSTAQRTSAGVSDGTIFRPFFFFVSLLFAWILWSGNMSSVSDELGAIGSSCANSLVVVVSTSITLRESSSSSSTSSRSKVVLGVLDVFASSWSTVPLICGESRCADARLV